MLLNMFSKFCLNFALVCIYVNSNKILKISRLFVWSLKIDKNIYHAQVSKSENKK